MNLHLAEISRTVAPAAHAVLLVDHAGWHLSARLVVPANITIIPLPPKSPELNPVENVWQYMRDNWLSNRIFKSYDDIVDHYRNSRFPDCVHRCRCDADQKRGHPPAAIMPLPPPGGRFEMSFVSSNDSEGFPRTVPQGPKSKAIQYYSLGRCR
jgi:hypothetical protein